MRSRTMLVISAAALLGLVAGALIATRATASRIPAIKIRTVAAAANAPSTTIAGGTPQKRALVNAVLRRLGAPPEVTEITIGAPPVGYAPAPEFGAVGSDWIYSTVQARESGSGSVRASWLSSMVAGGYRQLARMQAGSDLLGYSTTIVYPGGAQHTTGGIVAAPISTAPALSDSARSTAEGTLQAKLQSAFADVNAKGFAFESSNGDLYASSNQGLAAAVTVDMSSAVTGAAVATLYRDLSSAADGEDGFYVEVRDPGGAVAYAAGSSTITREGTVSGIPTIVAPPASSGAH